MSTYGNANELLRKLEELQQEINQSAPSSPTHSLQEEMALIRHGSPEQLQRYYETASKDYLRDNFACEFRAQFFARANRVELYPVLKTFDGGLYNEQVCLIPWGPSELRKQALLEFQDDYSLLGYGSDEPGLSRITMAMAWGDIPAAQALANAPVLPGESPASIPQAMLVGAMVALLRLSGHVEGLASEQHQEHQLKIVAVMEQALRQGAVLGEPCPEILPMLEFMDEGQNVGLHDNPVGRKRGFAPDYKHPPVSRYDRRPAYVTPAYLARQVVRNSVYESTEVSAEVFEAFVKQLGTSEMGRKVLTEVACGYFTPRFAKAMEGVELLLEDPSDEVWQPARWSLNQSWDISMPLAHMMLHKHQTLECATDEEVDMWVDWLSQEMLRATSDYRKKEAQSNLDKVEAILSVWTNAEQKEVLAWSVKLFKEALEKNPSTDMETKAFHVEVATVKGLAWSQVKRGELVDQPKRRSGPRL